jgi:hypothetical protein
VLSTNTLASIEQIIIPRQKVMRTLASKGSSVAAQLMLQRFRLAGLLVVGSLVLPASVHAHDPIFDPSVGACAQSKGLAPGCGSDRPTFVPRNNYQSPQRDFLTNGHTHGGGFFGGRIYPDDGYEFSNPGDSYDQRVRWLPGLGSREHPHVFAADAEGKWLPSDGYVWVNDPPRDFSVKWISGEPSRYRPHVRTGDAEGSWLPDPGYTWVNDPPIPGDLSVIWLSGVHSWPHVVTSDTEGIWVPDPGYGWASDPPVPGDFRVKWVPGVHSSYTPHIVSAAREGSWLPEDGYEFVDSRVNLNVTWVPGVRSREHPYIVASDAEGSWLPEDGYSFLNSSNGDLRVKWIPGVPSKDKPNIVSAATEGSWLPADGYRFVNARVNLDVTWVPGMLSRDAPHVVTADTEGKWQLEPGYQWATLTPGDFEVEPSPAPVVIGATPDVSTPDALSERAASLVEALNIISAQPKYPTYLKGSPLPHGHDIEPEQAHLNCQAFFRALGDELTKRHLPSWDREFPGTFRADAIVKAIDESAAKNKSGVLLSSARAIFKAFGANETVTTIDGYAIATAASSNKKWIEVEATEAQALADQGFIVIAGHRAGPTEDSGHLAVVVPVPGRFEALGSSVKHIDKERDGEGPFVRDGNVHGPERKPGEPPPKRVHSTWGAVHASEVMPLKSTKWYLWTPSVN